MATATRPQPPLMVSAHAQALVAGSFLVHWYTPSTCPRSPTLELIHITRTTGSYFCLTTSNGYISGVPHNRDLVSDILRLLNDHNIPCGRLHLDHGRAQLLKHLWQSTD